MTSQKAFILHSSSKKCSWTKNYVQIKVDRCFNLNLHKNPVIKIYNHQRKRRKKFKYKEHFILYPLLTFQPSIKKNINHHHVYSSKNLQISPESWEPEGSPDQPLFFCFSHFQSFIGFFCQWIYFIDSICLKPIMYEAIGLPNGIN